MSRKSQLENSADASKPGSDTSCYVEFKNKNLNALKPSRKRKRAKEPKKEKKSKIDWDYTNRNNYFRVNLGEGIGFAYLPRACKAIMDTTIFGRLDNIKQLGVTCYVYPDANHSRRSHSLGVAHLACEQALKLQSQKINGKSPMTGNEMLCVVIAALIHDLGHGPYSHLCEGFMVQKDGSKITHEEMSVLLFEKLLEDYPKAKERLDHYFDEYHYTLIKHLINPPSKEPWNLLGGPEKAFLYAIVNNPVSGLDVDKMEYLLRDSKRAGVNGIKIGDIEMCLSMAKICKIPKKHLSEGYKWLGYPENKTKAVSIFFESRQYLHETVYSHRTVNVVSQMMIKAIRLSLHEVKLSKGTKIDVPLGECFRKENLDLYIMLTDEYLRAKILDSPPTSEEIIEAQTILCDIDHRRYWRPILEFKRLDSTIPYPLEAAAIKAQLKPLDISFSVNKITVVRKDFNAGKGRAVNPMDHIPFYSRDNEESIRFIEFPKPSFQSSIFVIAPHGCTKIEAKKIEEVLREYARNNSIPQPTKLFKNDENAA